MDLKKMQEANRRRNEERRGICPFCAERAETPKFNATHGWADNVCKGCRPHRDWIARVALKSDHVVEYVLRRKDRWAAEREKLAAVTSAPAAPAEDTLERLERLDAMMAKIMQEFGIK